MRLSGYVVLGELGQGGMGRVLRVRHEATGAVRALKLLDHVTDPETAARFRREAEAQAKVAGSGVVPVHEVGFERGKLFIVMDLMAGGSLRARLKSDGRLAWREAVRLVLALARVLTRCHAAGLVHRDVKPDNVLFDAEGRPALADFGTVRDLERSALTESGTLIGTPYYMAPEQLSGERAGPEVDVYALGAVIHELVTGEPAFPGETLPTLLGMKMMMQRPRLDAAVKDVPGKLEAIVARCLSPDRAKRPSAPTLASELEALLARTESVSRRHRLWIVPAALGAVALLAVGFRPSRPPVAPEPVAPPVAPPVVPIAPAVESLESHASRARIEAELDRLSGISASQRKEVASAVAKWIKAEDERSQGRDGSLGLLFECARNATAVFARLRRIDPGSAPPRSLVALISRFAKRVEQEQPDLATPEAVFECLVPVIDESDECAFFMPSFLRHTAGDTVGLDAALDAARRAARRLPSDGYALFVAGRLRLFRALVRGEIDDAARGEVKKALEEMERAARVEGDERIGHQLIEGDVPASIAWAQFALGDESGASGRFASVPERGTEAELSPNFSDLLALRMNVVLRACLKLLHESPEGATALLDKAATGRGVSGPVAREDAERYRWVAKRIRELGGGDVRALVKQLLREEVEYAFPRP